MEQITVRIQGESNFVEAVFNVKELNMLKDSKLNLINISARLSSLLDFEAGKHMYTPPKKIETLLSQYVANLKSYEGMLELKMDRMLITSFRLGDRSLSYSTRVAGLISSYSEEVIRRSKTNPAMSIEEIDHAVLSQMISVNPFYKTEKYHSKSTYHSYSS